MKLKKFIVFLLTSFLFGAIDILSKYVVVDRIAEGSYTKVIDEILYLTRVHNSGAAFGFLNGNRSFFILITFVGFLALASLLNYVYNNIEDISKASMLGYVLIIGGAIGNTYDRVVRGFVVDFIDIVGFGHYVFNLADLFIKIGILVLIINSFIGSDKIKSKK